MHFRSGAPEDGETRSEIPPRDAGLIFPDLLRCAAGDDPTACIPTAGAHIDDIVGVSDHVKVMLDDDDGRTVVQQRLKNTEQHANIQRMQADGRLIEHKDGVRLRPADLAGELKPLCLAAGQARRFLAQRQVAEAQLPENGQSLADGLPVPAEFQRGIHVHIHQLRKRSALPRAVRQADRVGRSGIA